MGGAAGGGLGFFIWNSYVGGSYTQIVAGMVTNGIAGYISSADELPDRGGVVFGPAPGGQAQPQWQLAVGVQGVIQGERVIVEIHDVTGHRHDERFASDLSRHERSPTVRVLDEHTGMIHTSP